MKTILEVVNAIGDVDRIAVVLEDRKTFSGFLAKDIWFVPSDDYFVVGYGLRRYLILATKGNPTVLCPLFVQEGEFLITDITHCGRELRGLKNDIISNAVYPHFLNALKGHRRRMETGQKTLVERFGYDTKMAANILCLGLQGCELLLNGTITLPMAKASNDVCLAMLGGGYTLDQALTMIAEVANDLELALPLSVLPREPNLAKIEEWMLDTYQTYWTSWK